MAPFETAVLLIGSFGLGLSHAFEVDHLTAVSSFVAERPRSYQSFLFGMRWALGHGLSLLVFSAVLFALRASLSETVAHGLEKAVGVGLVWVGSKAVLGRWLGNAARYSHHSHGDGSFWMGLLHGLAGTAAYVGSLIAVLSSSIVLLLAYTAAFSLGVLLAMSAYAGLLGWVLGRGERLSQALLREARFAVGLWTCGLGAFWMLR